MNPHRFHALPDVNSPTRVKDIFRLADTVAVLGEAGHQKALAHLEKTDGPLSRNHRLTVAGYFNAAVDWGWLYKSGYTRAITYTATPRFQHEAALVHISKPIKMRPPQKYDESLLDSYQPNVTFYLSDNQRLRLHTACQAGYLSTNFTFRDYKLRRFLMDLSHHCSSFEGVRAKKTDTTDLLEKNIQSSDLSAREVKILQNHFKAIKYIKDSFASPQRNLGIQIDEYEIRTLHAVISEGLLLHAHEQGRLRVSPSVSLGLSPVGIAQSAYTPPASAEHTRALFTKLIHKAAQIRDPYEQALFLTAHLHYLQAFEACNEPLARVACNIPLLSAGIKPLTWVNVAREEYDDALVALYERKSIYGLCEIFTQACLRSMDQFDQTEQEIPDTFMVLFWKRELKAALQDVVIHGKPLVVEASNLPAHRRESMQALAQRTLEALAADDSLADTYEIGRADYDKWRDSWRASLAARLNEQQSNIVSLRPK